MNNIYIYGASGHGKVVLHTLLINNCNVTGFIDDNVRGKFCELEIFAPSELSDLYSYTIHFAIGNNRIRQRLQMEWAQCGVVSETVIHPLATVYPTARIGYGCLIAAGAIVGPDAIIGDGSIINHNAVVDHDCRVGAFCHVAPNATLGGAVTVGEGCLIGSGATVLQCINIGRRVTVGSGAVVIKDVSDDQTVIGIPAKAKC